MANQISVQQVKDLVYRIGCQPGETEDGRVYYYVYVPCSPECGSQALWMIVLRERIPKSLGAICEKCHRYFRKELEDLFGMVAVLSPTQQIINRIESEAIRRLRAAESTETTFRRLIGAK